MANYFYLLRSIGFYPCRLKLALNNYGIWDQSTLFPNVFPLLRSNIVQCQGTRVEIKRTLAELYAAMAGLNGPSLGLKLFLSSYMVRLNFRPKTASRSNVIRCQGTPVEKNTSLGSFAWLK